MEFQPIKTGIRVWQLLFLLLTTALVGNIIASTENAAGSATAAINFSMFVCVVGWLSAIYGLVTCIKSSFAFPEILIPADAAAALFTLIDGIVLAAKLKAVNCGSLDPKALPKDYIVWGSKDDEKRCREIQASTAFMWFLVLGFVASLFFSWRDSRQGFGGSTRSTRPSMSQVRV